MSIKLIGILKEIDFHSKLSRGHKPDWYQLHTPEFKPFDKSRDDVEENLHEKLTQQIPEVFYHATYKALIPSIKRSGLDTRKVQLAWEDSKPGIVYLANDPAVAESYAEAADEVSDAIYDSGIVILKVASKDLDLSKLHDDSNVQKDDSDTYEYHAQIPWSKLSITDLYDKTNENFADGKKPGRKGISKRVGIPKGATLTQLAKLAKAKGEKGRMARWQLNMRRGRKKKKK